MEQSNPNKIPSVKELIDYHHGNMSESEMYSIEKDALDDSFLDDALEGFKHDPNAIPHIEQLRKKIESRNKNNKKGIWYNVRPFYPHMAVAATLFVLAFSAYFILVRTISDDSSSTTSQKQQSNVQLSKNDAKTQSKSDSVDLNNTNKETELPNASNEKATEIVTAENNIVEDVPTQEIPTEPVVAYKSIPQEADVTADQKKLESTKPNIIQAESTAPSPRQDLAFSETVALEQDEAVTVSASKSKARAVKTNQENANRSATVPVSKSTIKSAQNFETYLQINPFTCTDVNQVQLHGSIFISFKTDENGKPEKIKIEKSNNESCNDAAKEYIRNAPIFEKKSGKRQTIELKY